MLNVALPLLPAHLVAYIGSFIKVNVKSEDNSRHTNLLLNLYKAFECIACESVAYEYESIDYQAAHLREYQAEVQSHLAALVVDLVLLEKCDYAYKLTQREIMYLFDCYYCDASVIMYGEETYEDIGQDVCVVDTTQMQHIQNEFLDCSEFTETLALTQMGAQLGLADDFNIKTYKYIRLLEEALRTKSTGLYAYMKANIGILPDMLLYIYIKHNHKLYAPKWYSLASDYLLVGLLDKAGILPIVLAMAISGKRDHYAGSEAALHNVVESNLSVVKQIVPLYISPESAVIPYENYEEYEEYEQYHYNELLTPYKYWQATYQDQTQLYVWGGPNKIIQVVGDEAIGAYLQRFE
jgi:hypothetical protein